MKKTVRNILLCILSALMLVFFVACNNDDGGSDDTSSQTSVEETTTDDATSTNDETTTEETTTEESSSEDEPLSTEVTKLEIDYDMTFVGVSLKDLSALFDEQDKADPYVSTGFVFPQSYVPVYDVDNDGDIDDKDYSFVFEITVDFEVNKHIDCIYIYNKIEGNNFAVEAGTPFNYEFSTDVTPEAKGWVKIDINQDTQYLNFKFKNSEAPYEIYIYGYDLGEEPPVPEKEHEKVTMDYLIGINGHSKNDNVAHLSCAGYYRDYLNWNYFYTTSVYPTGKPTSFAGQNQIRQAATYKYMTQSLGMDPVPCFMFDMSGSNPSIEGVDRYDPEAYIMYGEMVYQFVVRYGSNKNNTVDNLVLSKGNITKPEMAIGLNYVKWVELGNEPNGEGDNGFTPYQLAALTSCAIDGHNNTITSPTGSLVGAKVADPNVKVAMAGLAGIQTRYVKAMAFWLEHNRADRDIGIDAFNVHTYCRKTISYNGYSVEVGVSPEEADLAGQLEGVISFRDKYYPDVEVWLTEFGWDTNQSYQTEGSSHAYGDFTGREVQAIWLVRAYLILSSIGVDRAAMYMCYDVGNEETSVGKYGTSGVVTSGGEKKDSYFYIYTLKNTMTGMYFVEEIDSGNEDVWIYKFEDGNGKACYAVWCPTMDNVKVDGYVLDIGEVTSATLTEMVDEDTDGVQTELAVTNGTVTVNVSEKPVFVTVQ